MCVFLLLNQLVQGCRDAIKTVDISESRQQTLILEGCLILNIDFYDDNDADDEGAILISKYLIISLTFNCISSETDVRIHASFTFKPFLNIPFHIYTKLVATIT